MQKSHSPEPWPVPRIPTCRCPAETESGSARCHIPSECLYPGRLSPYPDPTGRVFLRIGGGRAVQTNYRIRSQTCVFAVRISFCCHTDITASAISRAKIRTAARLPLLYLAFRHHTSSDAPCCSPGLPFSGLQQGFFPDIASDSACRVMVPDSISRRESRSFS